MKFFYLIIDFSDKITLAEHRFIPFAYRYFFIFFRTFLSAQHLCPVIYSLTLCLSRLYHHIVCLIKCQPCQELGYARLHYFLLFLHSISREVINDEVSFEAKEATHCTFPMFGRSVKKLVTFGSNNMAYGNFC